MGEVPLQALFETGVAWHAVFFMPLSIRLAHSTPLHQWCSIRLAQLSDV
jgi:hypothetical protein